MSATLELPRTVKKDITPAELRAKIKTELGYNARQVTVSCGSSHTYLRIHVRCPKVDTKRVEELAASLHTWTMDQSDYCEGQSVHVEETAEVRRHRAAPFLAEITAALTALAADKELSSVSLSTGAYLFRSDRDIYVCRPSNNARGHGVWAHSALALDASCVTTLALQAARV